MSREVRLNIESLKKEYKVSLDLDKQVRLTHSSGSTKSKLRLLPYSTSTKGNELKDDQAIVGNLVRNISDLNYKEFKKEELFENVKENVISDQKEKLVDIIKEFFFDDNGQLVLSHPMFFKYLNQAGNNEKKVAEFLAGVLVDENIQDKVLESFEKKPKQVLLALLYDSMPDLMASNKSNKSNYFCMNSHIKNLFTEDLLFLLEDENLLVRYFYMMIIYYYFFYTTQIVLDLDRMFDNKTEAIYPVYFNVNWEKRSSSRDSYKQGWKMIQSKLPKLFSHINCINMINHVENDTYKQLNYDRLKEVVGKLSSKDHLDLANEFENWKNEYENCLNDVNWEAKKPVPQNADENVVLKEVRSLFHSINYQFQHSGRKKASVQYYDGIFALAKEHFLKQSGPLGYTLNLTQEYLILLTKLCIKDREKILLKELFQQLELRGVYFDRTSKKHVIELYERLNILEKKSDSGDAQYVKYVL
ncbi:DNA phosphorothioation-dependent restriction protein DptG [Texcoconibacillus texcoconensis]|uniref:DNA phosphorothioation-dependent restriction protein DptG n=1 Tax=Texcoconibacillus texcoconensis TaxID=1095777 RepID=A0A840QM65_9BACI|nr:DNA phosphorothioation-dependent restriction protein DptG [Texcoconibacillus texcoconensis]MBB5172443.1 DNA phosphorothioation-dependent restriction protein DptG [Texcoconibacillus texcoconensis]